jgi:hypothetical protein
MTFWQLVIIDSNLFHVIHNQIAGSLCPEANLFRTLPDAMLTDCYYSSLPHDLIQHSAVPAGYLMF